MSTQLPQRQLSVSSFHFIFFVVLFSSRKYKLINPGKNLAQMMVDSWTTHFQKRHYTNVEGQTEG